LGLRIVNIKGISLADYYNNSLVKVTSMTGKVVLSAKKALNFVSGYFGSKSRWPLGEGYQYASKPVERELFKRNFHYLLMANATVSRKPEQRVQPFGFEYCDHLALLENLNIKGDFQADSKVIYSDKGNLTLSIFENEGEIVIGFGNKSPNRSRGILTSNQRYSILNWLGVTPTVYRESEKIVRAILDSNYFKGKKVKLVGVCYRASLASYVASRLGLSAVCGDSAPLGAGLQRIIGRKRLQESYDNIIHISTQHDFVGENRWLTFFSKFFDLIGLRTPGNFGKRYHIPPAYPKDNYRSHMFFYSSIMKHLGYSERTSPTALKEEDLLYHLK